MIKKFHKNLSQTLYSTIQQSIATCQLHTTGVDVIGSHQAGIKHAHQSKFVRLSKMMMQHNA